MNKLAKTLSAFVDGSESSANLMAVLEDTFTQEKCREILDLFEQTMDSGKLVNKDYRTLVNKVNELRGTSDSKEHAYLNDHKKKISAISDESYKQLTNEESASQKPSTIGVGSVLNGRFILDEIIGQGGMGVIYKARDIRKDEAKDREPYVAIKVLSENIKSHPDAFIALQRETKKAQKLAHPNIVTVYDFDRDGDTFFMTMERLKGESLDKIIKREVPLPHQEAISIIQGMANGLAYAHNKGIVHLDFKPGNVFVTRDGVVKILDFGIAQAAKLPGQTTTNATLFDPRTSIKALTPAYASCEIIEEKPPDPRDDIYALGCVAYELLVGRHPFNKTVSTVARDSDQRPIKAKVLSKREWSAIVGALKFDRAERTLTANKFMRELDVGRRSKDNVISARVIGVAVLAVVSSFVFLNFEKLNNQDQFESELNITSVVHQLQLKAEQEFNSKRIIEPKGRNALTTYRLILKLDQDNTIAKEGISKIASYYLEIARAFSKKNDFSNSINHIENGLQALPDDSRLLELQQEVLGKQLALTKHEIDKLLAKAERQFSDQKYTQPSDDNALEIYRQILQLEPENSIALKRIQVIRDYLIKRVHSNFSEREWQKAQHYIKLTQKYFPDDKEIHSLTNEYSTRKRKFEEKKEIEKKIAGLFIKGKQEVRAGQITEPESNNAVSTYKEVLSLDPENVKAKQELERISNRLTENARQYVKEKQWKKSLNTIDSAIKIFPENKDLILLRNDVLKKKELFDHKAEIEREISELLSKAEKAFNTDPLTMQDSSSAYDYYSRVLKIDHKNTKAKAGIDAIIKHDVEIIEKLILKKNWERSREYLNTLSTRFPDNNKVIALRKQVESGIAKDQELATEKREIQRLFKLAKQQFNAKQLSLPKGDNAFETYTIILNKEPKNSDAKSGLKSIISEYIRMANANIKKDDFIKAAKLIESGLKIDSVNSELNTIKRVVKKHQLETNHLAKNKGVEKKKGINRLLLQAEKNFEEGNLIDTSGEESAFIIYTKILKIDPGNIQAVNGLQRITYYYKNAALEYINEKNWNAALDSINQGLQITPSAADLLDIQASIEKSIVKNMQTAKEQEQIKWLLQKAGQYIKDRRLAAPPAQNAYETFKEVLERDPGNARAKKGIEKISDTITTSARSHFKNGDWEQCLSDIDEGLKVIPNSKALLALRKQVESKTEEKRMKQKKKPFFGGW